MSEPLTDAEEPTLEQVENLTEAWLHMKANGQTIESFELKCLLLVYAELKATREQVAKDWGYGSRFAASVRERCFPEAAQWRPLPTMEGLLTQIDNMMYGLERSTGRGDEPCSPSSADGGLG